MLNMKALPLMQLQSYRIKNDSQDKNNTPFPSPDLLCQGHKNTMSQSYTGPDVDFSDLFSSSEGHPRVCVSVHDQSGAGFQQGPHLRTEKIPIQYE